MRAIDETDDLLFEEIVNDGRLACIETASSLPVTPGEDSFWPQRFRAVALEILVEKGLICDSGERRNGQIVHKLTNLRRAWLARSSSDTIVTVEDEA